MRTREFRLQILEQFLHSLVQQSTKMDKSISCDTILSASPVLDLQMWRQLDSYPNAPNFFDVDQLSKFFRYASTTYYDLSLHTKQPTFYRIHKQVRLLAGSPAKKQSTYFFNIVCPKKQRILKHTNSIVVERNAINCIV